MAIRIGAGTVDGNGSRRVGVGTGSPGRWFASRGDRQVLSAGSLAAPAGSAVLRGADLLVGAGEVVGLVGENGSGKSTLMKILVGAEAADSGVVRVSGRIGYCPQEPVLYERLTCDEHLELFGVAYGMSEDAAAAAAEDLYVTLGFDRWRAARVEELSGGTKAKLNLALALLADPEVLLLDEPYAGFDWDTYQKFWGLVADRRQAGRAVLVVSHFLVDEDRFDRVVELKDGRAVPR